MLLVDLLVTFVMVLALAALGLSTWYAIRWSGRWRVAAFLPVSLLVVWTLTVVLGWPSDHTLWPFELTLWGPVCLAYIAIVRSRHARWMERQFPADKREVGGEGH